MTAYVYSYVSYGKSKFFSRYVNHLLYAEITLIVRVDEPVSRVRRLVLVYFRAEFLAKSQMKASFHPIKKLLSELF